MRGSEPVYEFGHFHLDAGEQVLFCAGKAVHLTQKAFAVLRVLLENSGHLVTKEALMRQVWPEAYVEEGNLSQAIAALRRALGESHQSHERHEYIETVARRGFRFIAAVSVEKEISGAILIAAKDSELRTNISTHLNESGRDVRAPSDEEVHHLCMRGRYYWKKYTVEGLKKGIVYFRQAIKTDPDYALAYGGLAECYYRLSNIHLPPCKAMPKAKAAAMKALKLDGTLAETHALLGLMAMFYDRDWPAAEGEFKKAIELDPDSASSHQRLGLALGLVGRFDEAISEISRAVNLEPQSPGIRVGLGTVFHLARRYDAAISQAQKALDIEPEFFPAHVVLGIALLQQRRLAFAVKELEKAASLSDTEWTLGYLGYAYGISGRLRQALKFVRQLEQQPEGAYISPFAIALVHNGLRHKEQALRWIEKTYEDRNEMLSFIGNSHEFDNLRA